MSRSNRVVGPLAVGWLATALFVLAPAGASAQSFTHNGTLVADEYWAEGQHTVTGHITVPAGVTLTVEPGAQVRIGGNFTITVDGTLKVGVLAGSGAADPAKPVLFYYSSPSYTGLATWGGIVFNAGSSGHVFKNADVRNAYDCITSYATNGLTIEDSTIHYCYYNGIKVAATTASVVFKGTGAATVPTYGSSTGNAKAKIHNCGTGSSDSHGIYNYGALTVTNAEIYGNGSTSYRSNGIKSSGNTQITGSIIHSNTHIGIAWDAALPSGSNSLTRSMIFRNHVGGLYVGLNSPDLTYLVDHNTFDDNDAYTSTTNYEIYAYVTYPGLTVTNNIIGRNSEYGIYRSSSAAISNDYNLFWSNTYTNYNLTLGDHTTFCNPLFVKDYENYRITANSPARGADSTGNPNGDVGALFYVADPTPSLQGILRQSTTLSLSGSPYAMAGDLVIPAGVTLNIEPGVVINPASSDNMSCGYDTGEVELLVSGTLNAPGTATNRITFAPATSTSPGWWGGLRFEDGSNATSLNYLEIAYGTNCVWTEASSLTFNNSIVRNCSGDGYTVNKTTSSLTLLGNLTTSRIANNTGYGINNGGALTITASTITDNRKAGVYSTGNSQLTRNEIKLNGYGDTSYGYGVYFYNSLPSGNQSMSANLVHRNYRGGVYLQSTQAGTNDLIEHNTIDNNNVYSTNYGIYAYVTNGTVTVRDNIVTSNGEYGVYRDGSSSGFALNYNNIWNHSTDIYGTGTNNGGTGAVSCNPLYVAADGTNYRLTSHSPSRMADSSGIRDQGALFFVADDTPTLQGILRSSRTLTKAGSPWNMPGDLIIPTGVTLTLEAGAVLQPSANADAMRCGVNSSRAELVVRGALVVAGSASDRAVIEPAGSSTAKGQWEGVRFEASSTSNSVNFLDIEYPVTGVYVAAPGITLSNTRIHDAQTYGVLVAPTPASLVMTGEAGKHGGNFLLESAIWNVGNTTGHNGIYSQGDLTLSNTDVYNTWDHGVVFEKKATLTRNRIHNSTRGYGIWGGLAKDEQDVIQNNLIYANGYGGIRINTPSGTGIGTGTVTVDHNTIDGNTLYSTTNYGIYVEQYGGNSSTIKITNNIISNSGEYGIYVYPYSSSYRPAPSYNDFWNNSTDAYYVGTGSGNIVVDPLFNYPEATTTSIKDFRLQPPSNVRGKDNQTPTAGDLGALPFYAIPVDNVQITPNNGNVKAASTQTFAAQAYEGWSNFPIRGIPYAWAVVNGGGTINSAGLFNAGCTLGTYASSIQATAGGVPGTTNVTIVPGNAASVSVSPANATIDVNQSQTYTATAKDSCGNTTTGTVTWSITDPIAGVIDANGVFTANVYSGTYTDVVKAVINGVAGYASVAVNPDAPAFIVISPDPAVVNVGSTAQFTATGRDQWGNNVTVTPTWSVAAGCTAGSINAATGVFTASASPAVCSKPNAIRATQGAIVGNAAVEVKTIPVTCISVEAVSPANGSTPVKGTIQYKARGWSAGSNGICSGTELGITPTWTVTGTGNTVDASGKVTAGCTTGSFTVTAQSGAITGTASATITAGGVASIAVSPTTASVAVGATQTFTASGKDACNNTVAVTPVWSVVAGGGTIGAANGVFTAGSAVGTYANTIQASSAGVNGYASVSVTAGPLASITISPNPGTVNINGTVTFTATGADSAGNPVTLTPTWSVVNGGGTINSSTGVFTAGGTAGTFTNTVRAVSGSVSATVSVTINPGPLASITVSPSPATLAVNGSQQFTATGKDAGGNTVAITPTWTVAASGGTITSGGLFTAGTTVGTFTNTVKATSGAISGTATVTVTPGPLETITVTPATLEVGPGGTQTFTASGKDAYGNAITPLTVTWSRTPTAVGTINASTGAFTAGTAAGSYPDAIVATASGKTGTASVTINPGALSSITISPTTTTLKINQTQQFTATGKDASGNTVALNNPVWSVTDTNAGSIGASTGLFTAGTRPGTYTGRIRVEQGSISATASVTVNAGDLATIELTPSTASVVRSTTQQFTAAGKDSAGNTVPTGTLTWAVVNGGGTISASGLFTAGATTGTFSNTVRATGTGGVQGFATVQITQAPLASIAITPTSASLAINGTRQFTATGKDANGDDVDVSVTWSVTTAAAGSIDSAGLFTAGTTPGTYTGVVKASSGSISATASITVTAGPLATIELTPNTATINTNTTQQFTATGKDSGGNTVPTGTLTWSVASGGGTVNASGLYTAGNTPGTATVRATSGAISGNATVTINQAPVASITLTPASAALAIGGTQQFTATGKDANGNTVPATFTWSVVTAAAGSINGTGLFTAGSAPGTYAGAVKVTSGTVSATASITVNPGPLATIEVSPNPATVNTNATQTFTALGKDSAGNAVTFTPTWTVVSGGGTINSSTGVFTAGTTTGTFTNTVRASSGAISGTATVTVSQAPLASITITPNPGTVAVNGTVTFTAAGKDANGNPVSAPITWSVLDSTVGTINATSGAFTAKTRAGTFTDVVRASSGSITANASVTVNPGPLATITVDPATATVQVGGTRQFTAITKDAHGNPVTAAVTWSVNNATAGSINATGLFTAKTVTGNFADLVKATSGAISGTASVEVVPGSLATIEVTPANPTLNVGQQQQFTAVGKDANGNTVPVTLTWSLSDAAAGAITQTGLFTAGTVAGTYADVIKATANGITGATGLTINPGPIATVTVSPKNTNPTPGATRLLSATAKDANGNVVNSSFLWEVLDPAVGTLVPSGTTKTATLTASNTAGSYPNAIKVSAGGAFDTVNVTIDPGPLARVVVQPSPANVPVASQLQFTAKGEDSFGNEVTITPTWAVVTSAAGSITSTGRFTAGNSAGTYPGAVRASAGGFNGFADVVVQPGAVATITISPTSATVNAGTVQQFTAVAKDSGGNVLQVNVSWAVSNSQAGTINGNGLFTAGTRVGNYNNVIQASSGSVTATASVIVRPGPLAKLNLSPLNASVRARTTQLFQVSPTDQFGNAVAATPTWTVTTPTAGSITGTGLFTAGSKASTYPAAVKASVGVIAETADVLVTPGDLDRVVVTPANATLKPGQNQVFTAEGIDADNNPIALVPTWSVANPLAGTIDPSTGLFNAGLEPGSYANAVKATSNGRSGYASITVTIADVTRVEIKPENPTIPMGRTQQFTAVAYDSADREVRGVSASWKVVSGGGTIDGATGLFTAGLVDGNFSQTIEATIGGQLQTSSVTIPSDFDNDKLPDAWEVANSLDNTDPEDAKADLDGDTLTNLQEFEIGSLPRDADSDDDGVTDGNEQKPGEDTDGDGQVNALDPDSDNDALLDGVEMSVTSGHADTDLTKGNFKVDEHPGSSTDPLNADTDGDSLTDGKEDANKNGRVDPGETDPNHADTLCPSGSGCPDNLVCSSGVCVNPASSNPDGGSPGECAQQCGAGQTCNPATGQCEDPVANVDQGCGCSSSGSTPLLWAGLALMALALRRRVRSA